MISGNGGRGGGPITTRHIVTKERVPTVPERRTRQLATFNREKLDSITPRPVCVSHRVLPWRRWRLVVEENKDHLIVGSRVVQTSLTSVAGLQTFDRSGR